MRKQLHLSIQDPCHEDWDAMSPSERGRFCGACQKQVIDFSQMSDAQLVAFFKKTPVGSVCGRLHTDQLDRAIDIPKKRIPWVKYFFQFALPAFLASAKATAQETVSKTKSVQLPQAPREKGTNAAAVKGTLRTLSGKIVDEKNEAIVLASVQVKGTKIGTVTNAGGEFQLKDVELLPGTVLEISCIGFATREHIVTKDHGIVLTLQPETKEMERVVLQPAIYEHRVGKLVMGGLWIRADTVTVEPEQEPEPEPELTALVKCYPNPVQRNHTVNFEWTHAAESNIRIVVTSMAGHTVLNQTQKAAKGLNRINIIADARWSAGTYIVQLWNDKNELILKNKLVVQ